MINPNLILILVCLALIFAVFLVVIALDTLEAKAQSIVARCPSGGCVHLNWDYYADYPQGSKKYWNLYCGQMADLPDSLLKYKCK